jgi:hypothetical protein
MRVAFAYALVVAATLLGCDDDNQTIGFEDQFTSMNISTNNTDNQTDNSCAQPSLVVCRIRCAGEGMEYADGKCDQGVHFCICRTNATSLKEALIVVNSTDNSWEIFMTPSLIFGGASSRSARWGLTGNHGQCKAQCVWGPWGNQGRQCRQCRRHQRFLRFLRWWQPASTFVSTLFSTLVSTPISAPISTVVSATTLAPVSVGGAPVSVSAPTLSPVSVPGSAPVSTPASPTSFR